METIAFEVKSQLKNGFKTQTYALYQHLVLSVGEMEYDKIGIMEFWRTGEAHNSIFPPLFQNSIAPKLQLKIRTYFVK